MNAITGECPSTWTAKVDMLDLDGDGKVDPITFTFNVPASGKPQDAQMTYSAEMSCDKRHLNESQLNDEFGFSRYKNRWNYVQEWVVHEFKADTLIDGQFDGIQEEITLFPSLWPGYTTFGSSTFRPHAGIKADFPPENPHHAEVGQLYKQNKLTDGGNHLGDLDGNGKDDCIDARWPRHQVYLNEEKTKWDWVPAETPTYRVEFGKDDQFTFE